MSHTNGRARFADKPAGTDQSGSLTNSPQNDGQPDDPTIDQSEPEAPEGNVTNGSLPDTDSMGQQREADDDDSSDDDGADKLAEWLASLDTIEAVAESKTRVVVAPTLQEQVRLNALVALARKLLSASTPKIKLTYAALSLTDTPLTVEGADRFASLLNGALVEANMGKPKNAKLGEHYYRATHIPADATITRKDSDGNVLTLPVKDAGNVVIAYATVKKGEPKVTTTAGTAAAS